MANEREDDTATEAAFLEAIKSDPNDEATRLVYADWLEERGDERAEYVRLENQMWKIPPRIAELSARLDATWLAAVNRRVDLVLVSADLKINAIKLVRELTGLGLKDAKDMVDAMPCVVKRDLEIEEAKRLEARFLADCNGVTRLQHPAWPTPALLPSPPVGACRVVLASCPLGEMGKAHWIEVLRAIREVTGLGLADARALADRAPATLREGITAADAARIEQRFADLPAVVRTEA